MSFIYSRDSYDGNWHIDLWGAVVRQAAVDYAMGLKDVQGHNMGISAEQWQTAKALIFSKKGEAWMRCWGIENMEPIRKMAKDLRRAYLKGNIDTAASKYSQKSVDNFRDVE